MRERERDPSCTGSLPKWLQTARPGRGRSHEPGTPSGFPTPLAGVQALEPSPSASQALSAESRMGGRAAGTCTSTPICELSGSLTLCARCRSAPLFVAHHCCPHPCRVGRTGGGGIHPWPPVRKTDGPCPLLSNNQRTAHLGETTSKQTAYELNVAQNIKS